MLYNSLKSRNYYLESLILYKSNKYQNAIRLLKKIPEDKSTLTLLYNCYLKNNQLKMAMDILNRLKNTTQESFYKNIKILINYKNFDEVLTILSELNDSYNKNFYIAEVYRLESDYFRAIEYYLKALDYSKNSEIYYKIAKCYEKNSQFSNAVKYYEKVISMQDSNFFYINSLYKAGICYYKIGNFKLSEKYFLEYLRNNNGFLKFVPETLENLANIYERKGEFVKCIDILTKIEDISNNKVEIKKIDYRIAGLWTKLGKINFALNVYKKYYPVKNREDIFILKKLGELYLKSGDFKSSNIFFIEYIEEIGKFNAQIYLKIALNYLYENNIDKAKEYLLEIINSEKSGKSLEEALFYMGKINYKLKNYKTAVIYFNRLILINRFSPLSAKAVKYLAHSYYILKDKESFTKFFNEIPSTYSFIKEFNISLKEISDFIKNKDRLTFVLDDERKFKYFTTVFKKLANQNSEQIYSFINENIFTGDKVIIYYYAGEVFKQKGLDNKANFAFNKFLNSGFVSKYYFEYKKLLSSMLLYYFTKKDYKKVLNYFPVFSHIDNLSNSSIYIIGFSAYKLRLDKIAEKYLALFIKNSRDGEKLFKASFILDRLNFLDKAAFGYKKSLRYSQKGDLKIEALYWLGEIYRKKGKLETALNYFLKIKLMYPFDIKWTPTASFQVAKIFEQIGKKNRALKEYQYIYNHLKEDDPRKEFVKNRVRILRGDRFNENSRGNN
jgi:tetratricopeptide (TPR) repeat protein